MEKLRSTYVLLACLLLALCAQIPHAMYVFAHAPHSNAEQYAIAIGEWALAFAYAVAVESATFIFVAHNRKRAANGFAVASFAINLCYYAMHGIALFAVDAIPHWILSALLPLAIAAYSHVTEHATDAPSEAPAWLATLRTKLQSLRTQRPTEPLEGPEAPTEAPAHQPEPEAPTAPQETDEAEEYGIDFKSLPDDRRRSWAARLIAQGRTRAEVAELFGVHPSTVGRWLAVEHS
ncbi:MAG: helix-turn-helix domain-containing protein [Geminicoccaceae bacterium]|nr:helix-turn-helix domain-containing protein [Geminicoccaceae bacterium]